MKGHEVAVKTPSLASRMGTVFALAVLGCDGSRTSNGPNDHDAGPAPMDTDAGTDAGVCTTGDCAPCERDLACEASQYCSSQGACVDRCLDGTCLGPPMPGKISSVLGVAENQTLYLGVRTTGDDAQAQGGLWAWDLTGAPRPLIGVSGSLAFPELLFAADGFLYLLDRGTLMRVALSGGPLEPMPGSRVSYAWLTPQFIYWSEGRLSLEPGEQAPCHLWRKPRGLADGEAERVMTNNDGPYLAGNEDYVYHSWYLIYSADDGTRMLSRTSLSPPFSSEEVLDMSDLYTDKMYSDGTHMIMTQWDGCVELRAPQRRCLTEGFSSEVYWTWFVADKWLYWVSPKGEREYHTMGRTHLDVPNKRVELLRREIKGFWEDDLLALVGDKLLYLDGSSGTQRIAVRDLPAENETTHP